MIGRRESPLSKSKSGPAAAHLPSIRLTRPPRLLLGIGAYAMLLASSGKPGLAQSAPSPVNADPPPVAIASTPSDRRPPIISWSVLYNSDANANVSGGARVGAAYLQRIGLITDIDLHSAIGWRGARGHISVHVISGTGLSGSRVGNILTVSGLEASPALRLYNVWIEQKLGDGTVLRVGQFNVDAQFAISPTASLLVNSSFGWPGSFATDLPSGGPAYPLAGPGASLFITASKRTTIRLAMFSGDPAGQGDGDPQRRDRYGVNGWRLKGRPFVIGEIERTSGGDDPAWLLIAGGWAHFDRFDDVRLDTRGVSLADPTAAAPKSHGGNWAIYAIGDVRLWRSGMRSLRGFVRATASLPDRNAVDLYVDTGLALTGTFPGRTSDVVGIGVAIARLSPALRRLRQDGCANAGVACRPSASESVIEASYKFRVNDHVYVQPNVQWIVHPAGALVADPATPQRNPRNALVLGMRSHIRF